MFVFLHILIQDLYYWVVLKAQLSPQSFPSFFTLYIFIVTNIMII